jgi:serine O-acetyltransferase
MKSAGNIRNSRTSGADCDSALDPEVGLKQLMNGEKDPDHDWPERNLPKLADEIMVTYETYGDLGHLEGRDLPSIEAITGILNDLMAVLFPSFFGDAKLTKSNVKYFLGDTLHSLYTRLVDEADKSLRYVCRKIKECPTDVCKDRAHVVAKELLESIPNIRKLLAGDVQAAYVGDPAAKSLSEIILSYPCVFAIATYRIAHELHLRGVPTIPRIMSEYAHSRTGIDIHPGARIGKNFFIDHGTGVVIGETAIIGDDVRIYQGVTLGGQSFARGEIPQLRGKKRHPTIEDNVIIYAGATILGGKTVIGKGSAVGGNVWITSSIPANTTVMLESPKLMYRTNKKRKKALVRRRAGHKR